MRAGSRVKRLAKHTTQRTGLACCGTRRFARGVCRFFLKTPATNCFFIISCPFSVLFSLSSSQVYNTPSVPVLTLILPALLARLLCVTCVWLLSSWCHAGAQSTCSNGIVGVEATSLDACCVEACGMCGGPGCNPGANSTLTSADCCATEIIDSGALCTDTGAAPCIITICELWVTYSHGISYVPGNWSFLLVLHQPEILFDVLLSKTTGL